MAEEDERPVRGNGHIASRIECPYHANRDRGGSGRGEERYDQVFEPHSPPCLGREGTRRVANARRASYQPSTRAGLVDRSGRGENSAEEVANGTAGPSHEGFLIGFRSPLRPVPVGPRNLVKFIRTNRDKYLLSGKSPQSASAGSVRSSAFPRLRGQFHRAPPRVAARCEGRPSRASARSRLPTTTLFSDRRKRPARARRRRTGGGPPDEAWATRSASPLIPRDGARPRPKGRVLEGGFRAACGGRRTGL